MQAVLGCFRPHFSASISLILISYRWLTSLLTEPQMSCLYICEEQIIGPVEMAQKFNFRMHHLIILYIKFRIHHLGLTKIFDELTDFLILQKYVLFKLCRCVIYSQLAVHVVLASIKHLEH